MDITQNEFLNDIFVRINDFFADEVGPVAHILCEEVKAEWESDLLKRGQRPGLRNLPDYVQKLSRLIEDDQNRQVFLDSVFQIEALAIFIKSK